MIRKLRKAQWVIAILLVACGSLAACGGGKASPPSKGHSSSSAILVIDNDFNNEGLDPGHEAALTSNMVFRAVYDTLLTYTADTFTPEPWLATSWQSSNGDRVWTFDLRHDVKFSDGTPLTSADVVFSFNRLINLQGPEAFLLGGETVTASGPYTVVLTSSAPNPAIPRILEANELSVLNEKVVEAHGGTDAKNAEKADTAQTWLNTHSAGSGAYLLKSVVPHQTYTLEANPLFWGPKPYFQTVVVRDMTAAVQYLNVQRDTDEIALDIPNSQAPSMKSISRLQVVAAPSTNTFFMTINLNPKRSPVTANPHIQTAIREGLNYASLVQLGGPGAVQLASLIPGGILGSLPSSDAQKTDLAAARAQVAASGIKNPTFSMQYVSSFSIFGVALSLIAQKIESSLAQVGITVKIEGLPLTVDVSNSEHGLQQSSVGLNAIDYPDPNDFLIDCPGGVVGGPLGYTTSYDPTLAALCAKAGSTVGDSARGALFQQIMKDMNTNSPWIPEFQPDDVVVASSNLTPIVYNAVWYLDIAAIRSK